MEPRPQRAQPEDGKLHVVKPREFDDGGRQHRDGHRNDDLQDQQLTPARQQAVDDPLMMAADLGERVLPFDACIEGPV